jgi:hypothetical protein
LEDVVPNVPRPAADPFLELFQSIRALGEQDSRCLFETRKVARQRDHESISGLLRHSSTILADIGSFGSFH